MNKEKMKLFIKNLFPFFVIFVFDFLIINNLNTVFNNSVINANHLKYIVYGIFIAIHAILLLILFSKKFKKISYEKKYLILIIPIGLLYLFLIPLGRVPDEENHFRRAYEISEGHLISEKLVDGGGGRDFSTDIKDIFNYGDDGVHYDDLFKNIKITKNNDRKKLPFTNTSVYSFLCYLPQSIGIFVGRLIDLPTLVQAYLGRIMNFIVSVILVYFAIKFIPYKKNVITLFAFMPMMLQEQISLAPDALTNSVAFLLIAYVLCLKHKSDYKIQKKDSIIISILAIFMSMLKIVYLPICLILFLLPKELFKSKKDKYIKIFGLAIFVVIINMVWLKISSGYLNEIKPGVYPSAQLSFVIHYPIAFIQAAFNSFYNYFDLYLFNVIGNSLCYFDVSISSIFIVSYFIIIIFNMLVDNTDKIDKYDKGLSIFIICSTIILICLSLYLQWNPLQNKYIDGIQGRYFIPLLLLISLLVNKNIKYKIKSNTYIYFSIILLNIYSCIVLFFNHI